MGDLRTVTIERTVELWQKYQAFLAEKGLPQAELSEFGKSVMALAERAASPEGGETAKRELRIKELEGEISFVKECNRMVKAANDEAHRENEKLAAQVSQYAGKMLANQYDYTSVRRAGAEAMRERAAKWHDDAAEVLERDADAAASAGCYCADSGGDLRYYASLHRGHAAAIRALEIEG